MMQERARIVFAALVAVLVIPAVRGSAGAQLEEMAERAAVEKGYRLGSEIKLTLGENQAVRLVCADNAEGVKEVLVARTGDVLFIHGLTDGGRSGGGSALPRITGAIRQIRDTAALIAATWQVEGDKVTVTLRVETDKARNKELLDKFLNAPNVSKQIHNEVALTGEIVSLTAEERLEGFIRLWSEVKYNFAFFDQVPQLDWDQVLVEYLPRVLEEQNGYEYYRLLTRCIAQLNDGHTRVWGISSPEIIAGVPIMIEPVEGRALITHLVEADQVNRADLRRGTEITHVDGRPVKEVLEEDLYPYIFASTPQDRDRRAYPQLLDGPRNTEVSLRVRRGDGESRTVTLTRTGGAPRRPWTGFEYRDVGEGIACVVLGSFGSRDIVKEFDKVFEKIRQAEGLILDVRENGGGSTGNGYAIIRYLTDKTLKGSHWKTRQYMPAFRAWGREEKWYEGDHDPVQPIEGKSPFLGPLVVLIGPGTYSAAEDFLIPLHYSGRATLVGEPTAGSTGMPIAITLPRGGARICTKRDTYPDGREFVGIGVIPDVEVRPTVDDIVAGRDAVMEKGIEAVKAAIAGK